MKTINIKKTIKKFDEFLTEQQEEIINNYRYFNVEHEDFSFLLEEFITEVKEKTDLNVSNDDIVYSISDYGRNNHFGVYSKNVINQLISKYEIKGVYDIDTTRKIGAFLNHLGGGICSKLTTEQDLVKVYFEDDIKAEEQKEITEAINEVINNIINLCSEYFNKLTDEYNYLLSDESIKESLEANDYDFDVDTLKIY